MYELPTMGHPSAVAAPLIGVSGLPPPVFFFLISRSAAPRASPAFPRVLCGAATSGHPPRGVWLGGGAPPGALGGGASRAEILEDFPYLEEDDIAAALEYAACHVDHPVIRPA